MSVSVSLLLNDYSSLQTLGLDISNMLNLNLIEERSESEHYFYSHLSNGQYFSLGYQDYLENDNDIDFENFKYIIGIYLNKRDSVESQVDSCLNLFKELFEKLKINFNNNLKGLLIYDSQGLLGRLN